ncbi:glycosyl hydrolase family 28-related protein [Sphingomonas sp. H160509]|uniref:glycoside hydrolase family 28 protein n=1 Tax=Sphingomonas sp. H160509 TaxID=2955313 RepID=UPI002097A6C1|nr:glycosyl hydrolase family 28-related protein [Sphingomonas sp. H160509]MDD1451115.1 glycosyl hydrolase family 28-related protein [Sphingomonas sp. H160509]
MTRRDVGLGIGAALLPFPLHAAMVIDVRKLGARGNGRTIDSTAINGAIAAAAKAGGGTVTIPAGRYLCFSIRLKSHVTIQLAKGAVIEAADPARHAGRYGLPEDNGEQLYQDFGHSHWRNSLFWGDDVENVAIVGPGLIHGLGLTRDGPGARWKVQTGERPLSMRQMSATEIARLEPDAARMNGLGNKAIAFRNGRNIRLSGFSMLKCGHFAILATGTRDLHIHDLTIDTDRDGIDLDCVQRSIVERCRVNTPNDDAIVIKSSFALGRAVASEDVTVRHCAVSGYDLGTMLDGTRRTTQQLAPDRDRVTGRIKLGTESNGGIPTHPDRGLQLHPLPRARAGNGGWRVDGGRRRTPHHDARRDDRAAVPADRRPTPRSSRNAGRCDPAGKAKRHRRHGDRSPLRRGDRRAARPSGRGHHVIPHPSVLSWRRHARGCRTQA